ncbi:MAG: FAD-binding protein [Saprospiraceae bacterium]|nr:FAD-binding protein [Saprospiraceae bacterium]
MKIIKRGDKAYEEARVGRVFNHRVPDRYPIAIAFPRNAEDVATAVKLANTEGYKIATRAGGHSWAVWSVRDEAILIDLKYFNKIKLNKKNKIVQVQPAVKGGLELNPFLKKQGLMFAGGHCPTVGVGGFLLQGGQGWNARGWGWACEQIVALDIVTADGEIVRADATQNTDLYWAARGAGPGFFGIVTCFHLKTRIAPKFMVASTYLYPSRHAQTILKWLQEIHTGISTTVEIVALGQSAPSIEGVEGTDIPVMIVHVLAFEDTHEAGIESLKPFDDCPVIDDAYMVRKNYLTTFEEQFALQIEANPEGHRWTVNNAWLEGTPEEVSKTIAPAFTHLPNPKAFTLWYSMAPLRPLPDMAFSLQTDIYLATYVVWKDEKDDELNKNWVKNTMHHIEPVTAGQYTGDSDFQVHQRKFVSDTNWEKLKAIQKVRDPNNIFVGYLTSDKDTLNKNKFVKKMDRQTFDDYIKRFNEQDMTAFEQYLSPTMKMVNGTLAFEGVQGMKDHYTKIWKNFTEQLTVEKFVSDDKYLAVQLWARFTALFDDTESLFGAVKKGETFDFRGIIMYTLKNGQFEEIKVAYNSFIFTDIHGVEKDLGIPH